MAHYPNEDRRRLHEGRWDAVAWTDPAQLTSEAALREMLIWARDAYAAATQRLEDAAAHALREQRESHAARAALDDARHLLAATWRFARTRAQEALLNLDPAAPPLTSAEVTRRQRLFAQAFPLSFSELAASQPNNALTHALAAVKALQDGAELEALDLHGRLQRAAEALQATLDAWTQETREDRAATEAVWHARAAFDLTQATYADALRVALRPSGRLSELGRWLRAEDAAYKARRQANAPLEEEPLPPETPPAP